MFRIDSNLPQPLVRALPGVGRYSILGTDYDNYAVLYSCSDLGILHAGNMTHNLFVVFGSVVYSKFIYSDRSSYLIISSILQLGLQWKH